MKKISVISSMLIQGTELIREDGNMHILRMPSGGGGILLPQFIRCRERYLSFYVEGQEDHSVVLDLRVYTEQESGEPAFDVQIGILPGVRTPICIDRKWMDAHVLFPEANPGELKIVCHGRRVETEEIERIVLETLPCYHDLTLKISDFVLSEEYPDPEALPDGKLVDALGQNKRKEWDSKVRDLDTLRELLKAHEARADEGYPFAEWSKYGGWNRKKLGEGTGFFTKYKAEGRWWLADPLGYAFFSVGPDCVGLGADCRVDGVEKWLDWLPDTEDEIYGSMFRIEKEHREGEITRRTKKLFSFTRANLYRALGEDWYPKWQKLITGQLKGYGMNTLGNWSDQRILGSTGMPYVTSLPEFPSTRTCIFRDFPDVLSEEYEANAVRCAAALADRKNDPLMIGYFLRNEPAWAFVDHLVLADEVLYNPNPTVCKEKLIDFLKDKYGEIEALNAAYHRDLKSFGDLYQPKRNVSHWSEAAREDMKEFSRRMLRAYVEIPCRECRRTDPNHMILGMRWAWISDADLVTGWENFDVFSINCYAVDPTASIQRIADLGVDLPVMIGEFHFGALDAGPYSTGLEGVASQKDRGIAYRYYCEHVAAHPNGVGCHYFQCYDQFVLGRFDGENYNIGLFDITTQPYPEMMEAVRECSRRIYEVAAGLKSAAEEKARSIPMVAF